MTPIQALLARIRWDPAFGRGRFELVYADRLEQRLLRVPLERVRRESGQHFAFEATDDEGRPHWVPLHRVREVWRDGERIWARRPGDAAETP